MWSQHSAGEERCDGGAARGAVTADALALGGLFALGGLSVLAGVGSAVLPGAAAAAAGCRAAFTYEKKEENRSIVLNKFSKNYKRKNKERINEEEK